MIPKKPWRWSMRFPRSRANAGDRGSVPTVCWGSRLRRGGDSARVRARHIVPLLAMRRTKHGSGLGRWRWVVERTFAWLNQFRRLRVRYDKRADIQRRSSRWAVR